MNLSYFKENRHPIRDITSMPLFLKSSPDLLLATVGINILGLALPIVLMQVYDRIVPTEATSTLLWLVIGFFVALILESVLRMARSTISNWISARFEHLISYAVVTRWLNSYLDKFEKDGAGVHLDRLRAINQLKNFYAGQAFQIFLDLPFALLFLAVIAFLGGWEVAAYLVIATLVFMIIIAMIKGWYTVNKRKQKDTSDRRYNFLVECLSGIHALKAITLEEPMLRRHERLMAESADRDYDVIFIGNIPVSLGTMFSHFMIFGVLFVGGSQAINGDISLGSLAACTLLSGRFFQPFKSLAGFWVRHADIVIAKNQVMKIAELEEEADPTAACLPPEIEGSIELQGVTFRYYERGKRILNNVYLNIQNKEMVCFQGQGSSGTTTLLSVIYGMLDPRAGQVRIGGMDMSNLCHNDFRGRIEYISQQGTLFNGTIYDNLTLFDPTLRDAALDAAALLGLDEVLSELPLGYETRVGNRLYEFLPTGVIQRICLARALSVRPRILLLDKINDAMDSDSEQLFFWLLEKLKGNCTIVMATANPQILSMADTVYQLSDGRLEKAEVNQCY